MLSECLPVIDEALKRAGIELTQLDAVAVANQPGLAGSLLVGLVAAKTLALTLGIPLVAVNHLQAHVYACRIASGEDVYPCVALVVSGGHTSLFRCHDPIDFEPLGGTIDDAAGEAFDKVASMLGLAVSRRTGDSTSRRVGRPTRRNLFPRPFLDETDRLDFSFSGLKTAVRYALVGPGKRDFRSLDLPPQRVADVAASFQEAVVDCLVGKAMLAVERTGADILCVAGGVAANARLREPAGG